MPDGNYIYGQPGLRFSNDPTAMVKVLETPEAFYVDGDISNRDAELTDNKTA